MKFSRCVQITSVAAQSPLQKLLLKNNGIRRCYDRWGPSGREDRSGNGLTQQNLEKNTNPLVAIDGAVLKE